MKDLIFCCTRQREPSGYRLGPGLEALQHLFERSTFCTIICHRHCDRDEISHSERCRQGNRNCPSTDPHIDRSRSQPCLAVKHESPLPAHSGFLGLLTSTVPQGSTLGFDCTTVQNCANEDGISGVCGIRGIGNSVTYVFSVGC